MLWNRPGYTQDILGHFSRHPEHILDDFEYLACWEFLKNKFPYRTLATFQGKYSSLPINKYTSTYTFTSAYLSVHTSAFLSVYREYTWKMQGDMYKTCIVWNRFRLRRILNSNLFCDSRAHGTSNTRGRQVHVNRAVYAALDVVRSLPHHSKARRVALAVRVNGAIEVRRRIVACRGCAIALVTVAITFPMRVHFTFAETASVRRERKRQQD